MINLEEKILDFKQISNKIALDFIKESLGICTKHNNELATSNEYFPELKFGKYNKIIEKKITQYDYFVEKLISDELEELKSFKLLNLGLSEQPIKKYYQKFFEQKKQKIPKDVEEWTKILPKKFFINYLILQKNFEFDQKTFNGFHFY